MKKQLADDVLRLLAFLRHRPSDDDVENALRIGQGIVIHDPESKTERWFSHGELQIIANEMATSRYIVDMDTPLEEAREDILDTIARHSHNERFDTGLRDWGENPSPSDLARLIHAIENPPQCDDLVETETTGHPLVIRHSESDEILGELSYNEIAVVRELLQTPEYSGSQHDEARAVYLAKTTTQR